MLRLLLFGATLAMALQCPGAANAQVLISQAKAVNGGVTEDDTPGFPITLSQPGSYKLATNLAVPAGKNGIVLSSPDITIDLNGFRLAGADAAAQGIYASYASGVTIKNGTITGFAGHGIRGAGFYWNVEAMRVVDNGKDGISLGTTIGVSIRGSIVMQNPGHGIVCGDRCLVENSVVSDNLAVGIFINGGLVLGNAIIRNTGYGIQSAFFTGYGNNTLNLNNGGVNPQVTGVTKLQPNACSPACP